MATENKDEVENANQKQVGYVRLGNSGLKVSKIILGCMSYGSPEWQDWVLGEEEGIKHIKFALDNGINTFDTANAYSNGLSEVVLGKALKQHNVPREEVVILTKVFYAVGKVSDKWIADPDAKGHVNRHGLSRKHIFDSIKASLERLQVDYVDVLQCHRFDPDTPIEENMHALNDVVKAGYARYIGMSSCFAWQFYAMQNYAVTNNLTPFISMQCHHSLLYREEEREMLPLLKHLGVGCIPWSPLARGLLTRSWNESTTRSETDFWIQPYKSSEASKTIVDRVEELATKKGVKMAQIAFAWNAKKVTAPIIGTTKLKNLEEMIGALKVELTDEDLAYLEEPYKPNPIIGHS